jgi:hypothetical protein
VAVRSARDTTRHDGGLARLVRCPYARNRTTRRPRVQFAITNGLSVGFLNLSLAFNSVGCARKSLLGETTLLRYCADAPRWRGAGSTR